MSDKGEISSFAEKRKEDGGWVNGGFMVLSPRIFEYLDGDQTVFEKESLERLAHDGQLAAYQHEGFWQSMDTMRDKAYLEKLLHDGEAPWIRW